jgi:hypothetical protein
MRYTKEQVVAAIKAIDFKSIRDLDRGAYVISEPPKPLKKKKRKKT